MPDTEKFLARLAELNACNTSAEVADLLRKEGIKGETGTDLTEACVVARDLQRFEPSARVGMDDVWVGEYQSGNCSRMSYPLRQFILEWDLLHHPDLMK